MSRLPPPNNRVKSGKAKMSKLVTCRLITADGIIPAIFPMNTNARTFAGDKNIYVKDDEDIH
jgi:hypothetical protein